MKPDHEKPKPLVGISSCLLGMRVRYDGQDKFKPDILALIAPHVRLLPLCPESMAGTGIPRAPVNLIQRNGAIEAVGRDDPGRNVSARLHTMGRIVGRTYPELCGYIVQSRSPSCGAATTPVYNSDQTQVIHTKGNGLFVAALLAAQPDLPILDDQNLEPGPIDRFLTAVNQRARLLANNSV